MRTTAALLLLVACAVAGPAESVPADCVIVNHIDFAALRKTEVWARVAAPIREFLGEAMGLEGLFEGMGLDPDKDLVSLTFALGGDIPKNQQQVYAIARGTFDPKKFAECLAQSGIKPVERDGMTVFENKELQGKRYCGFNGAFGLVEGAILFADPAKGIDALGAAMKEGAPRSGIAKALEAAPEAHAWTVFLPTKALRDELAKEPEGAPFAALKSAVLAYKLGAEIELALSAEAESEELAKQVGVVAQAGLMGLGLKQRAKLECKGATLLGSLVIPLEDAMTMMGMPVDSQEKPGTSAKPVVAGGAPKIEGAGKLQTLALPGQVNGLAVSPDGTHVFVDRALESDVVLDGQLRVVGKTREAGDSACFAPDGRTAVWLEISKLEVRSIPDLRTLEELGYEKLDHMPPKPWAILPVPGGKEFAVVGWEGVWRFRTDPLQWGARGKAAIPQPIAGAIDAKTGLLVMIGDQTFEIFDPVSMKSIATVPLPSATTYDVAATGGRAWVATKRGVILPVDLETRKVLDPVPVGDGGVNLALSGSGKVLVATSQVFEDRDHHPTRVVAYEVVASELREIASATFVAPSVFNDVAILEGSSTAILGGPESLVWRYAEKSD